MLRVIEWRRIANVLMIYCGAIDLMKSSILLDPRCRTCKTTIDFSNRSGRENGSLTQASFIKNLKNGWHNIFGWQAWQLAAFPYGAIAGELRKNLSTDSEVNDFFAQVARSLSTKYDADIVQQGCIDPFISAVFAAKPETTGAK